MLSVDGTVVDLTEGELHLLSFSIESSLSSSESNGFGRSLFNVLPIVLLVWRFED